MQSLPDVEALARAEQDEVMALWSGLGYYARARNLHAAAKILSSQYCGQMPAELEALQSLPGIGRSTAAAILAQAFGQPAAVLDGNVKRVLARHAGIEGWPGATQVLRRLWAEAEQRLPDHDAVDYAQGMMDLGATLCLRRLPLCEVCPVARDCQARLHDKVSEIPAPKPRKPRPVRHAQVLIQRDDAGRLLLEKRPPAGIWGGLWSLPQIESPKAAVLGAALKHEFTHFTLHLQPVQSAQPPQVAEGYELGWHTIDEALALGLPQPVRKLIERHCQ